MVYQLGLIGYPLTFSLSPLIHTYWLEEYGWKGNYSLFSIAPSSLSSFIDSLSHTTLKGFNITAPYKSDFYPYVEPGDPRLLSFKTINTVYCHQQKWIGFNTDFEAFMSLITASEWSESISLERVMIVGGGGLAKAIISALKIIGKTSEIVIILRDISKGKFLIEDYKKEFSSFKIMGIEEGNELARQSTLFINATPLGIKGEQILLTYREQLSIQATICDYAYCGHEMELTKTAKALGYKVIDGKKLLLEQARYAFNHWFGVMPTISEGLLQRVYQG